MDHNPNLASSELGSIWGSYMAESLNICLMKHFIANVEDPDIKEIVQFSKALSEGHLKSVTSIFQQEGIPIPQGYTDADVNEEAPRLFSDTYYLRFLQFMARTGASINGMALGTSYREDTLAYYRAAINESTELYNRVINLMKVKGILVRTPYMNYPTKVEFIEDDSFLSGILTTNKRSLLAIEINHLSNNIEANAIGRTLMDALTQVTASNKVKQHLQDGYKLATDVIKTLQNTLDKNHTYSPFPSDSTITDSKVAPFSDKIMMGLSSILSTISMGMLGQGLAASMRTDLIASYTQLIAKVGKYASTGAKIAIGEGWMEKPPQTTDRNKLQK
ncbi:DUF3231 family protein [Aquibacillus koreensis]|uniref:DUF3231 family protein n=1 Tax=Aquibacillus koreensis TaxID=279446 RepID=A0A9X3WNZ6_9BACI|nr:DUF3231 family protein [Aquibacillus koreensis]MCT2534364.1 DUF3231 family protein [Aquibacillus koreensis]MDC3421671.1 DUF3231 family protein [Aquibacillus koreensis]